MGGDLVPMLKDGESLSVHRTCVVDHERLGWRVDDSPPAPTEPEQSMPAEPKRRGRPPAKPNT